MIAADAKVGEWTITGESGRTAGGKPTVRAVCSCGTVKFLRRDALARVKGGMTRSCGCKRGDHVLAGTDAFPQAPAPNGYGVVLHGSVRGPKWAAGAPEDKDPWYCGPAEDRNAWRFQSAAEAKSWRDARKGYLGDRAGVYEVRPAWFAATAPAAPLTDTTPNGHGHKYNSSLSHHT